MAPIFRKCPKCDRTGSVVMSTIIIRKGEHVRSMECLTCGYKDDMIKFREISTQSKLVF